MDHSEASRLMASEKYLLDELSPTEMEEFEEHLFGCHDCAMDVRAGSVFLEHGKSRVGKSHVQCKAALPAEVRPSRGFSWWRAAFAIPAMAILLIVVGYQNLVTFPALKGALAENRAPKILPAAALVSSATRGAEPTAIEVRPRRTIPSPARYSATEFLRVVCNRVAKSGRRSTVVTPGIVRISQEHVDYRSAGSRQRRTLRSHCSWPERPQVKTQRLGVILSIYGLPRRQILNLSEGKTKWRQANEFTTFTPMPALSEGISNVRLSTHCSAGADVTFAFRRIRVGGCGKLPTPGARACCPTNPPQPQSRASYRVKAG